MEPGPFAGNACLDDSDPGTAEFREDSRALPPVALVLLGASNLARAHRAFSRCLRANLRPRTVRILTALGPGRGYAATGGLWHLRYPPIRTIARFP